MPSTVQPGLRRTEKNSATGDLPIPWQRFILFCQELRYGELEKVTIQDGVPVLAETVIQKTKFT